MQPRAVMVHCVRAKKTGANTLFVVGGKEEKGRFAVVLLDEAAAVTQEVHFAASRHLRIGKNK